MKRLFGGVAALLLLLGCKPIEFKNGEVPEEYLSIAKELEGTYLGSFAGEHYRMVYVLEGNKPKIEFFAQEDQACTFVFGEVLSASVRENEDKSLALERVSFRLESENCFRAIGKAIHFDVSRKDGQFVLDASIVREEWEERICSWQRADRRPEPRPGPRPPPPERRPPPPRRPPPGYRPPPGNPPPPGYQCRWERRVSYLSGRFTQQ